jgi:hypothetical protein
MFGNYQVIQVPYRNYKTIFGVAHAPAVAYNDAYCHYSKCHVWAECHGPSAMRALAQFFASQSTLAANRALVFSANGRSRMRRG